LAEALSLPSCATPISAAKVSPKDQPPTRRAWALLVSQLVVPAQSALARLAPTPSSRYGAASAGAAARAAMKPALRAAVRAAVGARECFVMVCTWVGMIEAGRLGTPA